MTTLIPNTVPNDACGLSIYIILNYLFLLIISVFKKRSYILGMQKYLKFIPWHLFHKCTIEMAFYLARFSGYYRTLLFSVPTWFYFQNVYINTYRLVIDKILESDVLQIPGHSCWLFTYLTSRIRGRECKVRLSLWQYMLHEMITSHALQSLPIIQMRSNWIRLTPFSGYLSISPRKGWSVWRYHQSEWMVRYIV